MRREITGFSNPLLKEIRGLREKKLRKRAGLFLAEGLRIMTEAREAGFLPEMLFRVKDRPLHDLEVTLEAEVLANGGDVIETSADIMAKLSGKDNAQAVVGVYRDHGTALADVDRGTAPIWLVAQSMRDPGNLGTMLRTGDAVGAGFFGDEGGLDRVGLGEETIRMARVAGLPQGGGMVDIDAETERHNQILPMRNAESSRPMRWNEVPMPARELSVDWRVPWNNARLSGSLGPRSGQGASEVISRIR